MLEDFKSIELEKLRRKEEIRKAREAAKATLKQEKREEISRKYIGAGKAVGKYLTKKVSLSEVPGEAKKEAGAALGAFGKAAKKVALEGPGYLKEKAPTMARDVEAVGGEAVSIFRKVFQVTRGAKGAGLPRGIRHPDSLIKNKELYGLGGGMSEKLSPIGRRIDNPMELYFGSKAVEKDATRVLAAMESGASDINNISIMTGLSEGRVVGGLKYLKRQGYDIEFLEEV